MIAAMTVLAARAAEGGNSTATLVVAILSASGFGAIAAALVAGFFSKRKLGAEATEIITKAAAGVVTNLERELERQRVQNEVTITRHEQRMLDRDVEHAREISELHADHKRQMEEVRRVLQLHVAWDAIAIAKVSEIAGVNLPPAPPLWPPLVPGPATMDG